MSRTLTITVKGRNVDFTTQYDSVADLCTRVGELIANGTLKSEFALSLYSKRDAGLSTKQLLWLHFLVWEVEKPTETQDTLDFVKVVAMLHYAKEVGGLTWPKLRAQTGTGRLISLGIAGPNSSAPGSINVIDDDLGHRLFLGRIPKNGRIGQNRLPADVNLALAEICKNPDEAARLYGKRTGRCCYCGHQLDNYNSIELGYGPTCAEKWGRFHSYAKGAVEGAYDRPTPSEIQEAAK